MRLNINISPFLKPRAIMLSLFLIGMVVSFSIFHPALLAAYAAGCFAIAIIFVKDFEYISSKEKLFFTFIIAACAVILPINLFRYPTAALHFVMLIATMAASAAAIRDRMSYVSASLVALGFAQGSILTYLFFRGLSDYPLEDMVPGMSSNGVSSYLICLQINYCIANFHIRKKASLVTSAVTFFVCIVGYGRGSILASSGIMFISMLFSFQSLRRSYAVAATTILLATSTVVIVKNFDAIYDYAERNTKLSAGLFDEARASINTEYWSRMSGVNILIGANYDQSLIERFFNGNPHNSYIRAHHLFGLPYLLLMICMTLRPLTARISNAEKAFHMSMMAILLFRAWTEPIFFPTPFDLMFFSIFLMFGPGRSGQKPAPSRVGHETHLRLRQQL